LNSVPQPGGGIVYSGQIWQIELKLTSGIHSVEIVRPTGTDSNYDTHIETNKKKCVQFFWWNNLSVNVNPDPYACPP
jgi:hypothetical protein